MYENSGTQFSRSTTGIQSGPDEFDESMFVITFSWTFWYYTLWAF